MMELNRVIPPPAKPIQDVKVDMPEHIQLQNGLDMFTLSAGTQEVIKVELVFGSGSLSQSNPLVPSFAVSMLKAGTSKKSAAQISQAIDDYGAYLETDISKDFISITLFTLSRFLTQTLPILKEVLLDSVFPEDEFEIKRTNKRQKYLVGMEKVGFVASKRFQELLFSSKGYGMPFNLESYENVNRDEVYEFYQKHIQNSPFRIYVSGFLNNVLVNQVKDTFSDIQSFSSIPAREEYVSISPIAPLEELISKEGAMQSAIRIGRKLFNRQHEDYFGMKVLCTALGGYFGSRLMTNIREDKGYTYGIGAGIAALKQDGYFYISTEVGVEVTKPAIDEIYKELERLRESALLPVELELVQNYMLGSILKSFEGPFERMERFKLVQLHGFELDYYTHYSNAIRTATTSQLQDLAQKWFQKKDFIELVVGQK